MRLQDAVIYFGIHTPDALAVQGPDGRLTYGELDRMANRIAMGLAACGVSKGNRVAIWLDKSTLAVVSMQAILRLGAAYVPLDPLSPVERIHTLLTDSAVSALITTTARATAVLSDNLQDLPCLCVDGRHHGPSWEAVLSLPATQLPNPQTQPEDLAYILYTSGSTGKPKGVSLSHGNALAFVQWATSELQATAADRFANHAPFHFDLSVLDIYAAFHAGASVFLIPDEWSFSARRLVDFISHEQLTMWYSVPSVLILMMEHGGLLDLTKPPLRTLMFAGEPFPVRHLRRLYTTWPDVRFLNLYGPTETNVCTFYDVKTLSPERTIPVPIGRACSGNRVWAQHESGRQARPGEEGELIVAGPTVMLGYWGQAPQDSRPYHTGDIVRVLDEEEFLYVGRHDHMVKVRGYRVELGEIEAILQNHPAVREASVVVTGLGLEARLTACVASDSEASPTLLNLKAHCAKHLPRHMIIDRVHYLPNLPKTRNGKTDRLALAQNIGELSQGGV